METLFPKRSVFHADAQLLKIINQHDIRGITGCIVSGERFIADDTERKDIIEKFNAVAVDMESSAIAHTCFINEMPFVAMRCISDMADATAADTYEANERLASNHVGKVCLTVLSSKEFGYINFA